MKSIVIFALFSCFSCVLNGQVSNSIQSAPEFYDGTYQIEIHNVRFQPNIPGNINEIVESNRLDNEINYYPLDENIRIRILSKNEINRIDFQKLEFIKFY